jgi:transposase-like protein
MSGTSIWSDADKARIVKESYGPDVSVVDLAEHYGIDKSTLYQWRRELTGSGVNPNRKRKTQRERVRTLDERLDMLFGAIRELTHQYEALGREKFIAQIKDVKLE